MTSVNIFASCVSRDIFSFKHEDLGWEDDKFENYDVCQYINFVSPLFCMQETKSNVNVLDDFIEKYRKKNKDTSNFRLRCKKLDITKTSLSYITQKKSDFLILDNYIFQYDYLILENGDIITSTYRDFINFLIENNVLPRIKKVANCYDFSIDTVRENISKLARLIKEHYPLSNIILVEVKPALFYLSSNNKIINFDLNYYQNLKNKLEFFFDILKNEFSGCNIIKSPEIQIGDEKHTWGLLSVHYIKDYYNYCRKIINSISKGENSKTQELILDDYNREIKYKYFNFFYRNICDNLISKNKYLNIYKKSLNNLHKIKTYLEFPPSVLPTWLQRPFCQLKRRIVAK